MVLSCIIKITMTSEFNLDIIALKNISNLFDEIITLKKI